jgi:hypothetical protein
MCAMIKYAGVEFENILQPMGGMCLLPWRSIGKILFTQETPITQSSRMGFGLTARNIKLLKLAWGLWPIDIRTHYPCLFQSIT